MTTTSALRMLLFRTWRFDSPMPSAIFLQLVLVFSAQLVFLDGYTFSTTQKMRGDHDQSSVLLTSTNHRNNTSFVTIPLLPHHMVYARHLAEDGSPLRTAKDRPTQSKYSRDLGVDVYKADQMAGLFQGYGTHYADMWCGTPPQRQTVIVDTGSGVTAFPCQGCEKCGVPDYHIDSLFDESKSQSFRSLTCNECLKGSCRSNSCEIGMSYAEGSSWSAHEVADLCYVGGFHDRPTPNDASKKNDDVDPFHAPAFAFETKFGCQTRITGLFKTQLADGIMGMDMADSSFWKQMYNAGKMNAKAFSLCFSRKDEAARTGTESGAMSLGGTDDRIHLTPMVFTSSADSTGFYVVNVRRIYMRHGGGGTSAQSTDPSLSIIPLDIAESNIGRVIVDSGTTDTYFSRRLTAPFTAAYKEMTGETYDHKTKFFTDEELSQQPTILFQLKGNEELNQAVLDAYGKNVPGLAGNIDPAHPLDVILAIPPQHYFEYDTDANGYVARFYTEEGSGGVLGANAMMGHDVYFDIVSLNIGWSESDCDYTSLVSKYTDGNWKPATPTPIPGRIEPEGSKSFNDNTFENNDGFPAEASQPFCSGIACQVSIILVVVFAVAILAVSVTRRSFQGSAYAVAASELELRPGAFMDEDRNIEYRDEDEGGEFT